MRNLAYQTDEFYEVTEQGATSADKYLLTDRKYNRRQPTTLKVETGIDELGEIEIRSSNAPSGILLEQVRQAVGRLREIRALEAGWDSYGAPRVASAAFGPATKILLSAISRCEPPRIEANSAGGIDMIWEEQGRSLVLSALGDEAFEALLTVGAEVTEPDANISSVQAQEFLDRFCASR